MSVKDYIRDHYGPYMCGTDRHNWKLIRRATEEKDGVKVCEWCGKEITWLFVSFIKLAVKFNDKSILQIKDVMNETNEVFVGAPWKEC